MSEFISVGNWTTPEAPFALNRKEIIAVPPERVWRALTEPDELRQWWCDEVDVDLRVGGHLQFGGPHVFARDLLPTGSGQETGKNFEILEVETHERLTFRWCLGNAETRVTITLENNLEHTHLRVSQTADGTLSWPTDPDFPNWWWVALPALRNFLENGDPGLRLNFPAAEQAENVEFEVALFTFPWVIWQKLTDPTQLNRWWARHAVVDLENGGTFELGLETGGPSEIIEVEAGERLVHDWRWGEDRVSRVEWRVAENEFDTRVSVVDRGPWPAEVPRDQVALSWATCLLHLKQISERGVIPREYQN